MMNDQHDLTEVLEDDSRKNPIHIQLRSYKGELSDSQLGAIVTRGRDFFHTFVAATLRRRYRRLVPIYLVDDWVVNALGVFLVRGGRRLPGTVPPDESTIFPGGPTGGSINFSEKVQGLKSLLHLFQQLTLVETYLEGSRLLDMSAILRELRTQSHNIASGKCDIPRIYELHQQIIKLVEQAVAVLRADEQLRPYVNSDFAPSLRSALQSLVSAAKQSCGTPPPAIPATGFGENRRSGLLYGDIPALGIKGPAILLAPESISDWANKFSGLHQITDAVKPESMNTWFGVETHQHRASALGLFNVLQHELTHAMVALPNDPVGDFTQLFRDRWHFYDRCPGFEEGLCDATAAIATTIALLKAKFEISGRKMPRLHQGKYAIPWEQTLPAIAETYKDYFGKQTDTWLRAWESNNRDFGAFSGLVKLYSTNFNGINWDSTFADFQKGRISTGN